MGNESLVRAFDKAGLKLDVRKENSTARIGSNTIPVFAMGVTHHRRGDAFWMAPSDAKVEVLSHDRNEGQVVLFVLERERFFTEMLRKTAVQIDRRIANVVSENDTHIWVRRRTDGGKRHFLMGHDERPAHYFIAQLPGGASSVRQAHEVLKNPALSGSGKVKSVRQGEWFFVPTTKEEDAAIEAELRKPISLGIGRKVAIGPAFSNGLLSGRQFGGNPHIADEAIVFNRLVKEVVNADGLEQTVSRRGLYVRGKVRHSEHDTVEFYRWMKVLKNTEAINSSGIAAMRGVAWVD